MADSVGTGPWSADLHVPDDDLVFFRVFTKDFVDDQFQIKPRFFRNRDGGMSGDWSHYCPDPNATRERIVRNTPGDYCVRQIRVRAVRSIMDGKPSLRQDVIHKPEFVNLGNPLNNRAHVDVTGPKSAEECDSEDDSTEIRNEYATRSTWAIAPPKTT